MHKPLGKCKLNYYYTIVTIETQSEIPQLSHKSYFLYIYIHYGTQIPVFRKYIITVQTDKVFTKLTTYK